MILYTRQGNVQQVNVAAQSLKRCSTFYLKVRNTKPKEGVRKLSTQSTKNQWSREILRQKTERKELQMLFGFLREIKALSKI